MKWQVLIVDNEGKAKLIRNIDDLSCVILSGGFVADEDTLVHWSALKEVTITRVEK